MKKNYSSPSIEVVIVESDTMLLAGSGSSSDKKDDKTDKTDKTDQVINKVTIDGNGSIFTFGGETETETDYAPW